jgi:hypothetical protein
MRFCKFSIAVLFFGCLAVAAPAHAVTCTNATLKGVYGIFYNGYDAGEPAVNVGQITSTGTGDVTGSFTHSVDGKVQSFTLTGTYALAKNCTGTLTYTADSITDHFSIVMDDSNKGVQLVRTDADTSEFGFLISFGTATCGLSGKTATFATNRAGDISGKGPVAYVGQVTLDGKGNLTGTDNISVNGAISTAVAVTGTYTQNSSCIGTVKMTPAGHTAQNYTSFAVNSGKELLLIETDSGTVVGGNFE